MSQEIMRVAWNKVRQLWDREEGQDLVEWALLLAFVVLGSAGLMYNTKAPVAKIWTATNTALTLPTGNTTSPAQPIQPKDGGGNDGGGSGSDGGSGR